MIDREAWKRLPIDLKRELLELAVMHLATGGTWDDRELFGETHNLSDLARQAVVLVLQDLLDGKRPQLRRPGAGKSADERYVSEINRALGCGARSLAEAYQLAAGSAKGLARSNDARVREAKRAWSRHKRSVLGGSKSIERPAPRDLSAWLRQREPDSKDG
jgi:hypothetical protein